MAITGLKALGQYILREVLKDSPKGVMTTLPNKDLIEINVQVLAQRLMQGGIDPTKLKNANQVENAIKMIENRANVQTGFTTKKSADVFDLEGKKIDPKKGIMGGKQIPDDDLPPPGSRGGKDDIAAPVQSGDESLRDMMEAEIKKKIEKENKEAIEGLKQKMAKEKARTQRISGNLRAENMQRTKIGEPKEGVDYDYYRELLDDDEVNVVMGDETEELLEAMVKEAKDEVAYMKRLYDKGALDPPEDMAQGGRAGYFLGGLGGLGRIIKAASETSPLQAYKRYLQSVKDRAQKGDMKSLAPELGAVTAGGVFINRRMQDVLKNMKEKDMENNLENFKKELNADPFYQKYPDIKDKVLENYTEKMFGEKRATGGRAGFFMGNPNPKGLGLLRAILNYMAKTGKEKGRFQELGLDLSGLDMLRLSNPKSFNKLLDDVRGKVNIKEGIMGTDTVRAQQQALREKRKGLTEKSLDVAKAMKKDQDRIAKKIAEEAETTIIPEVKERLMKDMGMSEEAAEKAARDMAEAASNIKLRNDPPKITEEGILQLENVLKNLETGGKKKRELNAIGGRIGYKLGSIDKARRAFLKTLGAVGAGIGALKTGLLSIGKGADAVKNIPPIKTPVTKLEGTTTEMPEWFPSFINKFRDEGKATNVFKQKKVEVTKAEYDKAIAEGKGQNYFRDDARTPEYKANNPDHMDYGKLVDTDERIYTTYTNDKVPGVRVDDMDGNVDVMFENDYSQPVSINYTAPGKKGPETGRVDIFLEGGAKMETKPKGDFVANDVETYATDPDGGFDTEDVIADTLDDMMEGTTRQMEEYATGKPVKGLSKGEGRVVEREIQAEQAADAAAEAAAEAGDEFASGGIARMLGE